MKNDRKTDTIKKFKEQREELNKLVFENSNTITKRFFNLDTNTYKDGAIPVKYKEMMGYVGSLLLRCDDCILYHISRLKELGVSKEEFVEATNIALIIGGSIIISHLRRAYKIWFEE